MAESRAHVNAAVKKPAGLTDPYALTAADRQRRMGVLLLVVFVDLLGFGVLIPLIPFYAARLGLEPQWITLVIALHSLMQFVGAPYLGRLSDRFGRRPVLALSMLGHTAAYGLLIFADSIAILIVSRLLSGLTSANLAAAYAYVADITPPERRAEGLARVSAAFALGFALGPALGGLLAGDADPLQANLAAPALAACLLSLVSFLGIVLRLPESLMPAAVVGQRSAGPPFDAAPRVRDRALTLMITLALLVFTFAAMRESLLSLWLHDRLAFDTHAIGMMFTINGVAIALIQSFATGPLTRRFGSMVLLRAGVVCYALSWLGLVLAGQTLTVVGAMVAGALGTALFGTSLQTLVTMRASPATRGAVMGAYQSGSSLARFSGAAVSGTLYGSIGVNAPFALGAVAMLPALALTFAIAAQVANSRDIR